MQSKQREKRMKKEMSNASGKCGTPLSTTIHTEGEKNHKEKREREREKKMLTM